MKVEDFAENDFVDTQAKTKGKGFTGCIVRWNFSTQDATHGNSLSHRAPGSIGQCQDPGRVFKGKKMAGRHGGKLRTTPNLKVIKVMSDERLLLVSGAVPGHVGSLVRVIPAKKNKKYKYRELLWKLQ